MEKEKNSFALVIPAYNEEKRIAKVLKKAKKYASLIIVVDDGSIDKTGEIAKNFNNVIVLSHLVNLGKGAALKTGCRAALILGVKILITLDADGQHDPSDIPRLLEKIKKEKADFVLGVRNIGKGMPFIRYLGNKITSFLLRGLFGIKVSDPLCGFRAFTKKIYPKISWKSTDYGVETEMIVKLGLAKIPFVEIPIKTLYIDKYKGVSILEAYKIIFDLLKWRFWR